MPQLPQITQILCIELGHFIDVVYVLGTIYLF